MSDERNETDPKITDAMRLTDALLERMQKTASGKIVTFDKLHVLEVILKHQQALPAVQVSAHSRLDHDADECGCENHAPWCPFNPHATQVQPYPLPPSTAAVVHGLRDALAALARRWEGPDKPGCWCERSPILTGEHDARCIAAGAALAAPGAAVQVSGEGERPRRFRHRDGWLEDDGEMRDHESYAELRADGSTWFVQRTRTAHEQIARFVADGTWVELAAVPAVPASQPQPAWSDICADCGRKDCRNELHVNLDHPSVARKARAIVEALGFDPTNHHNAMACPYCNPDRLTLASHPPPRTEPDADEGSRQSSPAGSPLMARLERLEQEIAALPCETLDGWDAIWNSGFEHGHKAALKQAAELAALLRSGADEDARQSPSVPRGATGSPRTPQPKGAER